MTATSPSQLLSPDHGIDATQDTYRDTVTAVLRSLATAGAPEGAEPGEDLQLAARTVDALDDVAEWANSGLSADPTACAWLSYLRWAGACGAKLPASSPVAPSRDFDRDFPLLSRTVATVGDSFAALATGEFGEVARPVDAAAESTEVLTRSIPYGLVPHLGWKALVPIVVDSAAITHGHAEAQTAAVATALAVHASVRARETGATFSEVLAAVTEVCAEMTRPAPRTLALLRLIPDLTDPTDLNAADAVFSRAVGDGTRAPSAVALGLAAAALAQANIGEAGASDDTLSRALVLVTEHPASSTAARSVTAAVMAARWGTRCVPADPLPVVAELDELARQWCHRWCPGTA